MSLNRTQRQWVKSAADASGYSFAVLAALVDKESDGKFGWDVNGKKLPALNIEGHRFYKYLALMAPDKLKLAVEQGLAAKKRGVVKVPGSYAGRYAMLDRMVAIHKEAAYMSCSYGVGQIMGENAQAMGFASAEHLYANACYSGENQIKQMILFIATKPALVTAMHAEDVTNIAYFYNGSAYKTNQYDTKLAALIDFYEGKSEEVPADNTATDILALGYESVKHFQREHGLNPDGIVGQITRDKVAEVKAARKKKQAKPAVTAATVAAGTVTVGGTTAVAVDGATSVTDVIDKAKPVIETVQSVGAVSPKLVVVLVAALIVGVIAFVVIQKLRKR